MKTRVKVGSQKDRYPSVQPCWPKRAKGRKGACIFPHFILQLSISSLRMRQDHSLNSLLVSGSGIDFSLGLDHHHNHIASDRWTTTRHYPIYAQLQYTLLAHGWGSHETFSLVFLLSSQVFLSLLLLHSHLWFLDEELFHFVSLNSGTGGSSLTAFTVYGWCGLSGDSQTQQLQYREGGHAHMPGSVHLFHEEASPPCPLKQYTSLLLNVVYPLWSCGISNCGCFFLSLGRFLWTCQTAAHLKNIPSAIHPYIPC